MNKYKNLVNMLELFCNLENMRRVPAAVGIFAFSDEHVQICLHMKQILVRSTCCGLKANSNMCLTRLHQP
jgi:hypothetical protein